MKSNDSIKIQKLTLWVNFQGITKLHEDTAIHAFIDACEADEGLILLDWEYEDLQLITEAERDVITEKLEAKGEV